MVQPGFMNRALGVFLGEPSVRTQCHSRRGYAIAVGKAPSELRRLVWICLLQTTWADSDPGRRGHEASTIRGYRTMSYARGAGLCAPRLQIVATLCRTSGSVMCTTSQFRFLPTHCIHFHPAPSRWTNENPRLSYISECLRCLTLFNSSHRRHDTVYHPARHRGRLIRTAETVQVLAREKCYKVCSSCQC